MSTAKAWIPKFYEGLRLLKASYFPKTCQTCGKTYATMDQFLAETSDVGHPTGLMEAIGEDHRPSVGLFRDCHCGSTLMIECGDRRDQSAAGQHRREIFQGLLDHLIRAGIEESIGRDEIIRLLRGDQSVLVERLGEASNGGG